MLIDDASRLALRAAEAIGKSRGVAFRFREWWPLLWRNKMSYFIAWVLCGGLMGVLYFGIMLLYSTLVLCIFIPVLSAPLLFYQMLVCAAVFGETYRESEGLSNLLVS